MTLKDTLLPADKNPLDDSGNLTIHWQQFFRNLEKVNVLGETAKLDTATATNAQIAGKLNELIQLLRDNKFIDDSSASDP